MLELYYWEALTGGEIGELLGVPEDTARSRLRRARLLLEAEIQRLGGGHDPLAHCIAATPLPLAP